MEQKFEFSTKKQYQKRPYFWYSLVTMLIIFLIISVRLLSVFPFGIGDLVSIRNIYSMHFSVGILFLLVPVLLYFLFKQRDKNKNTESLLSTNPHKAIVLMVAPLFVGLVMFLLPIIGYLFLIVGMFAGCSAGGGC